MTVVRLLPVVAAALIDDAGRVLVQQRPAGKSLAGLWEFPGGKVEAGETPEAALVRELGEELGITVDPGALNPAGFASEPLGDRHLLLLLFVARRWNGAPRAVEAADLRWVDAAALAALPMPGPDRPLLGALAGLLAG
jgi:8-oxo-dGTP diphosphatase